MTPQMTPERWRELKAVVQQALDAPPAQRAELLERSCGSDTDLRREAEELLAAASASERFLDSPAAAHFLEVRADDRRAIAERLRTVLAERYAIEREIGRGGMATVFLARDLRHDRPVALKVLLPELAAVVGSDRFLSEIRVTANLQHPHLLPLFDSGSADGLLFYTMPYVEGESLRNRLVRERPMPIEEAVRIGVAVAGALDYAHRRGVIHRDLKPENILLLDGQPVVADFGIALAVAKAGGARVTETGISLGTPHYMSPEQATGDRTLDGRSDVYSLGCVVYEMLTGEVPHTGSSMQAVIARLLTDVPTNVRTLRPRVPEHVASAVMTALEKLPVDRWSSAQAFAAALEGAPANQRPHHAPSPDADTHPAPQRQPANRVRRRALGTVVVLGAGAVLAIGTMTWRLWRARSGATATPVRFTLVVPDSERVIAAIPLVTMAPDGRSVVYVGPAARGRGQRPMLYHRRLDDLTARPLAATEGALRAAFSPDSRWLAFIANGALMKMPVTGGEPVALLGAELAGTRVTGVEWGPNDELVVVARDGLYRASSRGGALTRLTTVDTGNGEVAHHSPRFLRHGSAVAFTVSYRDSSHVDVLPGTTEKRVTLLSAPYGAGPRVLGLIEDHLLIGRSGGTVAALPVDVETWRVMGEPVVVLDTVAAAPSVSVTDGGSLAYVRGRTGVRLAIVDEHGKDLGASDEESLAMFNPQFSPDGRNVALHRTVGASRAGAAYVWTYDLSTRVFSRLTAKAASCCLSWMPDGRRIAYRPILNGRWNELWWVPSDGAGREEPFYVAPETVNVVDPTVSPDSRFAVFTANSTSSRAPTGASAGSGKPSSEDLWLVSLAHGASDRRAVPLLESQFNETDPRISPDGRWLAYASDESGQMEVYVRAFPTLARRSRISTAGGSAPVWARDGRRLFYRENDRLVSATLAPTGPSDTVDLTITGRQTLFQGRRLFEPGDNADYDVHPDGKRFALVRRALEPEVVVVLNWTSELSARLTSARSRRSRSEPGP